MRVSRCSVQKTVRRLFGLMCSIGMRDLGCRPTKTRVRIPLSPLNIKTMIKKKETSGISRQKVEFKVISKEELQKNRSKAYEYLI